MAFRAENISNCVEYEIPSFQDYLAATNTYGIAIFTLAAFLLLSTSLLFLDTLRHILENTSCQVKECSALVMAVYPLTSLVSFFAILVPRAHLLSEAITQGAFMIGMYELFCLFVAYCGGEFEMKQNLEVAKLNPKSGPCCCWPCCCFKQHQVTEKTLTMLRVLVFQLPLVQCFIYLVYLIMWAERESLYQVNYMYLQPILIASILFGIWGMTMTIQVLSKALDKQFYFREKFIVLQMVLVFSKLQGLLARVLVWSKVLPCTGSITPQVYANLLHNTLMITEMTMLSFLARKLYKKPLPDQKADKIEVDKNKNIFGNKIQATSDQSANISATVTFNNEAYVKSERELEYSRLSI